MRPSLRLVFFLLLAICAGCATRSSGDDSFALGREQFSGGDSIEILHVSRSPSLSGSGVTVVVQGRYVLQSQESATLALNLTTSGRGGPTRSSPMQRQKIDRGTGEFELSREGSEDGDLHVSFYPTGGGSDFGGVYFEPRGR
jgi:hypothetical protein